MVQGGGERRQQGQASTGMGSVVQWCTVVPATKHRRWRDGTAVAGTSRCWYIMLRLLQLPACNSLCLQHANGAAEGHNRPVQVQFPAALTSMTDFSDFSD